MTPARITAVRAVPLARSPNDRANSLDGEHNTGQRCIERRSDSRGATGENKCPLLRNHAPMRVSDDRTDMHSRPLASDRSATYQTGGSEHHPT